MKYDAIIADPPWDYKSSRALVGNGGRGSAGADRIIQADVNAHYPTMTLDEIKALPVPTFAAKNCLLFMWTTNPFLCDGSAASIVKAWGFEPKTVLTWGKTQKDSFEPSMKTGHWFRSASEHVIFAVKGKVPRPASYPAIPTWFAHPRLGHSEKPTDVHHYAELAMPFGNYLELFARRPHPGWDVWGNEVEGIEFV